MYLQTWTYLQMLIYAATVPQEEENIQRKVLKPQEVKDIFFPHIIYKGKNKNKKK